MIQLPSHRKISCIASGQMHASFLFQSLHSQPWEGSVLWRNHAILKYSHLGLFVLQRIKISPRWYCEMHWHLLAGLLSQPADVYCLAIRLSIHSDNTYDSYGDKSCLDLLYICKRMSSRCRWQGLAFCKLTKVQSCRLRPSILCVQLILPSQNQNIACFSSHFATVHDPNHSVEWQVLTFILVSMVRSWNRTSTEGILIPALYFKKNV